MDDSYVTGIYFLLHIIHVHEQPKTVLLHAMRRYSKRESRLTQYILYCSSALHIYYT